MAWCVIYLKTQCFGIYNFCHFLIKCLFFGINYVMSTFAIFQPAEKRHFLSKFSFFVQVPVRELVRFLVELLHLVYHIHWTIQYVKGIIKKEIYQFTFQQESKMSKFSFVESNLFILLNFLSLQINLLIKKPILNNLLLYPYHYYKDEIYL